MLVSKNAKLCITPNVNAKICVTPNANPQREQVEYRWPWVPNRRGWRWACRFHAVYFLFPRTQFPVDYGLKGCLSFKRGEEWLMGAAHERHCTKQTEQPPPPPNTPYFRFEKMAGLQQRPENVCLIFAVCASNQRPPGMHRPRLPV